MIKNYTPKLTYSAPDTSVVLIEQELGIATSAKGAKLQDMDAYELYDEDF